MTNYTDEEFKQQFTEEQRSTETFNKIFDNYKSILHDKGYLEQDQQWQDTHVQVFDDILENVKRGRSQEDSINDVIHEYRSNLTNTISSSSDEDDMNKAQ